MSTAEQAPVNASDSNAVYTEAQKNYATQGIANTGSSGFYGALEAINNYLGPAGVETAAYLSGNSVVTASVQAASGSMASNPYSSLTTSGSPYTTTSSYGSTGSSYTGYGSYSGSSTSRSTDDLTSSYDLISQQMYEGQLMNMELMVLQNDVATINRNWQITSTVQSNGDQTKMAMVRNMKQ